MDNLADIMKDFRVWLESKNVRKSGRPYAERTVKRYYNALKNSDVITDTVKLIGFDKITDVKPVDIDILIHILDKVKEESIDKRGHRMYSSALERYIEFLKYTNEKKGIFVV